MQFFRFYEVICNPVMKAYRKFLVGFLIFFPLIYGEKALTAEKEISPKPRNFEIYIGEKQLEKQNEKVKRENSSGFNKRSKEKALSKKTISNEKELKSKSSVNGEKAERISLPEGENAEQDISLEELPGEKKLDSSSALEGLSEREEKNTVKETFAPLKEKEGRGQFLEDYSWIFDSKKTLQEFAVVPIYYMSRTYGPNWGLRLFTFSPSNEGYYFSASLTNQIFSSLFIGDINYREALSKKWEISAYGQFFNYFEPYFDKKGMETRMEEENKVYAHKLTFQSQILFKEFHPFFYGMELGGIFFKDQEPYVKDETYFKTEFLIRLKFKGGYDSRSNWKDPTKGSYHQVSLACVPLLNESDSYCLAEADFRTYIPLHKQLPFFSKSILALRGFVGTSLMAPPSYSMNYKMGGSYVFRGFTSHRFRGDKIYFGQSELRMPLWKKTVSGAVFFELGETAEYSEPFSGFLWDFGLGLRFGVPPSYDIKLRMDLGFSIDKFNNASYNFLVNFFQAF